MRARTTASRNRGLAGSALLAIMAAAAFVRAQPALAQWAPETACDSKGGYELDQCLDTAVSSADAALNAEYRKAEANVTASDGDASAKASWTADLVSAQRAWIAFRDANCKFELIGAEWSFGSGANAAQKACLLAMTQARTTELTQRYTSN